MGYLNVIPPANSRKNYVNLWAAKSYATPTSIGQQNTPLFNDINKPTATSGGGNYLNNVNTQSAPATDNTSITTPTLSMPNVKTTTNTASGTSAGAFVPTMFNGQLYNDESSLTAAKLAYYQQQHDTNVKTIDAAYQSGLITFDERKTALDQNRQSIIDQQNQAAKDYRNNLNALDTSKGTTLGAIQASYAQASPDVVQSSQNDYQNKAIDQYNTGVGTLNDTNTANTKSIDTALGNLGTANDTATAPTAYGDLVRNRANYDTTYQNNLTSANDALTNQTDTTANDLANYTATQKAAAGSAAATRAANTTTVDPNQILGGLADTFKTMTANNFNPNEIKQSLRTGLANAKIDPSQIDPILNYFYGNFLPRQGQTIAYPNGG